MESRYISDAQKNTINLVCNVIADLIKNHPENRRAIIFEFQKKLPIITQRITPYNKMYLSVGKDEKEQERYAMDYYKFLTTNYIIPKNLTQEKNLKSAMVGEFPQEDRVVVEIVPEFVYIFNESYGLEIFDKVRANKYPYAPFFVNAMGNHPFTYTNLRRITSELKLRSISISPPRKLIIDNFIKDLKAGRHLL